MHACGAVQQFHRVVAPGGKHALSRLTWKRDKIFIVKVLAHSLHKHYDHGLSIKRFTEVFPFGGVRLSSRLSAEMQVTNDTICL